MSVENLKNKSISSTSTKGGYRVGSGRKKGGMNASTLEKHKVLKAYREKVMRNAGKLFNAQITIAQGCSYLFKKVKDKKGNFGRAERVTDPEEIESFLNEEYDDSDKKYYYITTVSPNNNAIDSMLDRTFGKASQSLELSGKDGEPIKYDILSFKDILGKEQE